MPNLLGVTNPVPNYDNTINNRPLPGAQRPDNSLVQNVADPKPGGPPRQQDGAAGRGQCPELGQPAV